jgi:DNA polymerase-3 subunit gamma/tau
VPAGPSLYRRHRPRTFADVIGQEHVVRTLRNAIEQDKVHHAYLFVGSRGTGKTSMAKILAACLNCVNGPTIEPCGQCESCTSIASATSLDVIELDAASNNSVDDIRALREQVAYAPVSGRHKVYILDEAHMLSTQAWNAFLKTLEEPPPNTIFVLATTEANKVLPTVVDRCHRFDFQRPTAAQLADVLGRVAAAEGIELPDDARAQLARHATGSFRDALGTLEQVVTMSGPKVELDAVLAVLGVADSELLFQSVDAVLAADPRAALLAVDRLAASGRDLGLFVRDLEAHVRALLVVSTIGEVPAELHVTVEEDARLADQAQRAGAATVVHLLDLIAEARESLRNGGDPRVALELVVVKAAAPEVDAGSKALLARIERLESRLAAGGTPAPGGFGQAPAVSREAPAAPPQAEGRGQDARPEEPEATTIVHAAASAVRAVATATSPSAAAAAVAEVVVEAVTDPQPAIATAVLDPEPEAPADPLDLEELDLDGLKNLWPGVLETVRTENTMLAALLDAARPVALQAGELRLAFAESASFLKRKAEDKVNLETVGQALQKVAGRRYRLAYELSADLGGATGDISLEPAETDVAEDELIGRFMTEFDAEELPPEEEAKA